MWLWRWVPLISPGQHGNSNEGKQLQSPRLFCSSGIGSHPAIATGWPHAQVPHIPHPQQKERRSSLTFCRVLAKLLGFTCSRFPRMGRGAGPGGIFPFPDLPFHAAKESRQAMQTKRTTVAPPRSSIFFCGSGGSDSGCQNLSLYTNGLC